MSALRLRQIDAGAARLAGVLGAGLEADIVVEGMRLSVEIGPASDGDLAGVGVSIATEHGAVGLYPADELMRVLTGIDLSGPSQYPDPAVRGWAIRAAALRLPEEFRALFEVRAVEEGVAPAGEARLALALTAPEYGWRVAGRVAGRGTVLAALLSSGKWRARGAPRLLNDLPLRHPVVVGEARLAMRELKSLAAGDVVLLDRAWFDRDGNGAVRLGACAMRGRLSAQAPEWRFQFEGWREAMEDDDMYEEAAPEWSEGEEFPAEEEQMPSEEAFAEEPFAADEAAPAAETGSEEQPAAEDTGAPAANAAPPSFDDLPLTVTVEVGRLDLRLAELQRLAPGSVLQLEAGPPPLVVLRCNGMEVARGELVEVEQRLAVQITSTEARHGPV